MIARHVKLRTLRTLEEESGPPSCSARFTADGLDGFIPLTADEIAWLRRARAAGTPLVLTISEEAAE